MIDAEGVKDGSRGGAERTHGTRTAMRPTPKVSQNEQPDGSSRIESKSFHWRQSIALVHLTQALSATAFGVGAIKIPTRGCAARPPVAICDGLRRRCNYDPRLGAAHCPVPFGPPLRFAR